jgi:hypothetical protein
MSCDNSICLSDIVDLVPRSNPAAEPGEPSKCGPTGVIADRSKSKGHRHDVRSHTLPDSTQIDPEHVWGDEGPINE